MMQFPKYLKFDYYLNMYVLSKKNKNDNDTNIKITTNNNNILIKTNNNKTSIRRVFSYNL